MKNSGSSKVTMSRSAYIKEHERLVEVLKHPTKSNLLSEQREQSDDLQRAKRGGGKK